MNRALEGCRILDLSRLLPGPYCSMMLAGLGAEVIKVEEPKVGDPTRKSLPLAGKQGIAFAQLNRDKKSLAIDLKHPEGREVFLKLASSADVLLEQFRPGVCDRLGIGYSVISQLNPRIVFCSLTGFGQNGPHRDRSGHDLNYLALSGVLGLTSDRQGFPVIPGVQVADIAGGMVSAFGILAALMARERTGRGQFVDISMFDVMMGMLTVPSSQQFAGKAIPVGGKYGLSGAYPFYNIYRTSDGRFMTLGALEPKFWVNFCHAAGREDLASRQFDEGAERDDLFQQVTKIFESRSQAEWIELMKEADCCCEPVLSMTEAFSHPQAVARAMIQEFSETGQPMTKQLGLSFKLSETPAGWLRGSPLLGQHTDELLAEAGLPASERERLRALGVVRTSDN